MATAEARILEFEQVLSLIILNSKWLDQVTELDRMCYKNPWSRELFKKEFLNELSLAVAVVRGNELVSHCFSHIVAEELHILNVAVHGAFRGQGVAKTLLCYVLVEAISRGTRYATLEVRSGNVVAQKLYTSLGFRLAGIRRHYYHDNLEDALVLARTLAPRDEANFCHKLRSPATFDPLFGYGILSVPLK